MTGGRGRKPASALLSRTAGQLTKIQQGSSPSAVASELRTLRAGSALLLPGMLPAYWNQIRSPRHRRSQIEHARYALIHSSRSISPRLRILLRRSTPISCLCGLGMVSLMLSLTMNRCLPPANGPSKPRAWSFLTSSSKATGVSFGTLSYRRFDFPYFTFAEPRYR